MAWTVQKRPDIACTVYKLSLVTEKSFDKCEIDFLNQVAIKIYSDLSFADNDDHCSLLGHIFVSADSSNRCSILQLVSQKSKRVTSSSLAAEALEFDNFYLIKHDIGRILKIKMPILMLTDFKVLFDVLTRSKYTMEKHSMIEMADFHQAYQKNPSQRYHLDQI